ncbi:MAG: hypothetical protein RL228_250 [Actinomycetota bacterium]
MKSKLAVVALTLACLGYLAIGASRAFQINGESSISNSIMSIAVFAIIGITGALIVREIMFGYRISQMSTILDAEQLLLPDDLPHTASGQTEKSAADERFKLISKEVETNPDSWRAWFRVAIAYDEARDRKRARAAMRQAEKLFRQKR